MVGHIPGRGGLATVAGWLHSAVGAHVADIGGVEVVGSGAWVLDLPSSGVVSGDTMSAGTLTT